MTRSGAPALQLSFGILLLFYCYCTGVVLLLYWLWTGLVLDRDWTGIGRTPATGPRYQLLYGLLLEAG